jgi:hypothetical protein
MKETARSKYKAVNKGLMLVHLEMLTQTLSQINREITHLVAFQPLGPGGTVDVYSKLLLTPTPAS